MNGIHDMGGMHGFGPVRPLADGPAFHARWESRVLALNFATGPARRRVAASGRKQIERIPPADYLRIPYYQKWLESLIATCIEAGLVTAEEIGPGMLLPAPAPLPPARADNDGPPRTPAFAAGDRVRARNIHPTYHTRLPRYVRGHAGVIVAHHGNAVFDDSRARGLGDDRQPLYTVRFTARELWGEQGHPADCVHVELWEDHLEPE
jgi:nitrile hydratase